MRWNTLGARTARWYAGAATATLACLFAAGYQFLQSHLLHGLDLMNEAEFHQIEAHLGPDYATLSAPFMEVKVRDIADFAYALFYVEIHVPQKGSVFQSTNLQGQSIPDVHGQPRYNSQVPGVGEVRAQEFRLPPFEVVIATPLAPVREILNSYIRVALALLAVMLFVSLGIGTLLSRMLLKPVRMIRDTANRIRSDNLSERIAVRGDRDEMDDLARLLNQMFDRLEAAFAQIRRFTSDASHELKTPLALIGLHSQRLLANEALNAASRESVHVQLEEIAHLNRIIEELLLLSRADANAMELKLTPQDPGPFLQALAQDAQALAEHHGKRFQLAHAGSGQVAFEQRWMRQVLFNLLTNAIQVSPPGGLVSISSTVDEAHWRLQVRDRGPGVSAEMQERMFERFVRVALPEREYAGSGLGLAICRSIVTLHKGTIHAQPAPEGLGLCMVIELPAMPAPPAPP
jgi:two-component system heavy metal sensor histidine kinase CusS